MGTFFVFFGVSCSLGASPDIQNPLAITYGDPKAPMKVVCFSCFTCHHCAEFYSEEFPKLEKHFLKTGKIFFVFYPYPTDQRGLEATLILLQCPDMMRPKLALSLFQHQETWLEATNLEGALSRLLPLSKTQMKKILGNTALQKKISSHGFALSQKYGIEAVPSFIIHGRVYDHYLSYQNLKDLFHGKKPQFQH